MQAILLLTFLSLGFAPSTAVAQTSVTIDKCQEQCSLERDDTGRRYVNCSCAPGSRARNFNREIASGVSTMRAFPVGDGQAFTASILACRGAEKADHGFANLAELRVLASRQTLSLCECALVRTHFPVKRICARRQTGEIGCRFQPDEARPALRHAYRLPTTEDYQSCLAAAANYERPESCGTVSRCESRLPHCAAGEEASNEADPEACCPVFVCRKSKV
ncbi:MAG: hypothetical protein EOP11_12280 [Proteobacteria bacterium]|nr:MAG: hypothetical protein EOP11_12280 [Pseudomonadota bacterium]